MRDDDEQPAAGNPHDPDCGPRRRGVEDPAASPESLLPMLAHELRTPLQVLRLSNELMLARSRADAPMPPREWWVAKLERSRRTITRLAQLVETILGTSQVGSGAGLDMVTEPVDLRQLVQEVVAREQEELDWAGCVCVLDAPTPQVGRWDRARLDLVVSNLLSNAAKYGRGQPIQLRLEGDPRSVRLSVTDGGPGIPPERQDRLFQRWSRLHDGEAIPGLGLGLWITRQIVESMAGRVTVHSAPGQGATFEVELPRGTDS